MSNIGKRKKENILFPFRPHIIF
uniref:Uncharacterized protein n=1 Tax=Rhizophora mucronata TaxID=61149 RepID=A0A2P2NEW9_RHIMU